MSQLPHNIRLPGGGEQHRLLRGSGGGGGTAAGAAGAATYVAVPRGRPLSAVCRRQYNVSLDEELLHNDVPSCGVWPSRDRRDLPPPFPLPRESVVHVDGGRTNGGEQESRGGEVSDDIPPSASFTFTHFYIYYYIHLYIHLTFSVATDVITEI